MRAPVLAPLLSLAVLGLSGCATTGGHVAPQLVPAADVIRQVKYEVGKFAWTTRATASDPSSCLSNFQLIVDKADIDLTTTTSSATNATAGAQVPINIVRLGIGGGVSSASTNTQSLHLVVLPQPFDGQPTPPAHAVWQGEPLFGAMMDVYRAIVAASDQRPCVGFDTDNSVSFGFSAERHASVNGSIGVFVLSLGADHSSGGSAAHSVTLHFKAAPHSVGAVPRVQPKLPEFIDAPEAPPAKPPVK